MAAIDKIAVTPIYIPNLKYGILYNNVNSIYKTHLSNWQEKKFIFWDDFNNDNATSNQGFFFNEFIKYAVRQGAHFLLDSTLDFKQKVFESDNNAIFELVLKDIKTGEVIVIVCHDTDLGNSYFFPPDKNITIPDAIVGAINGLKKGIEPLKAH
jgi:hypothetical protein